MRGGGGTVTAVLPEGAGTVVGKLQFVDNAVDASSGTVRVKAQFDNQGEKLWPGAFVTVRLAVQTLKGASVIPQAAVIQSPRGRIVYVVDGANKAAARPVEIVYASGEEAAVTGVKAGEKIVLDGRQNLRPGANVVERSAGDGARGKRGAAASSADAASAPTSPAAASGAATAARGNAA